jgi:hypothetical protein
VKREPHKSKRQRAVMKPFRKMLRAQRQAGTVLHYVPTLLEQEANMQRALAQEKTIERVFGEQVVTRGEDGTWRIHEPKTAPPQVVSRG